MGRLSKLFGGSKNEGRSEERTIYPTPPSSKNTTVSSRYSNAPSNKSNSGDDNAYVSPANSSPSSIREGMATPPITSAYKAQTFPASLARPNSAGRDELLAPPSAQIYNTNRYSRSLVSLHGHNEQDVPDIRRSHSPGPSPTTPARIIDSTEETYSSNIKRMSITDRPGTGASSRRERIENLLIWRWVENGKAVESYHIGNLGRGDKVC